MPHLFVNRSRAYDLLESSEKAGKTFVWESVNAILYIFGGIAFVLGSIFFFPELAAEINWGVWAFFIGSVLYLIVTGHDLIEVIRYHHHSDQGRRLELIAAAGYLIGTMLFLVGSVFFFTFVNLIVAGAWCFIIGSVLFTVAPFVNVLQVHHFSKRALQLYTLTGISFVAGAVAWHACQQWFGSAASDEVTASVPAAAAAPMQDVGTLGTPCDLSPDVVDAALAVAHDIDAGLAERLERLRHDHPDEFEAQMRRQGQRLVRLAVLRERNPDLYDRKLHEFRVESRVGAAAHALRTAMSAEDDARAYELEQELRQLVQEQLLLTIKARGEYLIRLEEHVEQMRSDLTEMASHFSDAVDLRVEQLKCGSEPPTPEWPCCGMPALELQTEYLFGSP